MTNKMIKLIAPNGLPIIGILLESGGIGDFEYFYDPVNRVRSFILKPGAESNIVNNEGDHVLIDSERNQWFASDVEFDSILKS